MYTDTYKGVGTTVELSTAKPTVIARVGKGTTMTFQHNIPEGYEVRISGTAASYNHIPDSTDAIYDAGRIASMKAKGVLAEFDEFDVIRGKGMHSVFGLAINGVKFELVAKETKPMPEGVGSVDELPEGATDIEELDWNALRNLAKSLGVPAKMGDKREEVEARVAEKLSELADPASSSETTVVAAGVVKANITFACK